MNRVYRKASADGLKVCNRCNIEMPATTELFVKDASRKDGLGYECRKCHSERKAGRDKRSDRWANMTEAQKSAAKARNSKYAKTNKGRAVFLRKAYQRVDSCDMTTQEVHDLIILPCTHCGTIDEPRGLDRIDNNLPHIKSNVVPSCAPCNFARGDRFSFDEMQKIGAVIRQIFMDRKTEQAQSEGHL